MNSLFGQKNSLFRRKNSLFSQKNSLFFRAEGIGVQTFDLSHRLDTKNARKGRIRKNSLLNSLFSGNLKGHQTANSFVRTRILETPRREPQPDAQSAGGFDFGTAIDGRTAVN